MSDESSLGRRIIAELSASMRDGAINLLEQEFVAGFDEAANIALGLLTIQIDGLLAKIQSGQYLSKEEQFLLAHLKSLKDETEAQLRKYGSDEPDDEPSPGR